MLQDLRPGTHRYGATRVSSTPSTCPGPASRHRQAASGLLKRERVLAGDNLKRVVTTRRERSADLMATRQRVTAGILSEEHAPKAKRS